MTIDDIESLRRELDPRPVTEEFAKSVAVETAISGKYLNVSVDEKRECIIWFCGNTSCLDFDDSARHVQLDNPTIGQFWMACRLFGVTVKSNT